MFTVYTHFKKALGLNYFIQLCFCKLYTNLYILDALVMDTKNIKLEQEIIFLSKEGDQYKRTLTNMRSIILKLNENFSKKKGKSNQLMNENEWLRCSYSAELKVHINTNI